MCTIEIYVFFAFLPALTRSLAKYLLIKNYLKEKLLKRLRLFSTIISHILLASFMWCRSKIYLNFTFFFVAARALTDRLVNSSTSGERMNERLESIERRIESSCFGGRRKSDQVYFFVNGIENFKRENFCSFDEN